MLKQFTFIAAIVLAVFAALSASSIALAATLEVTTQKDGKVTITLTGEIVDGDSNSLKSVVQAANAKGQLVARIRLNSPGGSLVEGINLADIIRFGKIATSVTGNSTCASSCFIVFAAGTDKSADYTASIGVHGASDEAGQETPASGSATITMARIARALGVPSAIIGKMVVTSPDQMVWLTPDDLRSMGAAMLGKPSQVPPEQPLRSQLPSQLRPEDRSVAAKESPPSWDKLLDRGLELSTKQHSGKPDIQRICQPEFKECINGLSFTSPDGTDMIMKVTEDMNGKTLKRELCSFNQYGDVRVCIDWDTGEQHRDMKNSKGDWYRVDDK